MRKAALLISSLLIAVSAALGAWAALSGRTDARIPIHWDAAGHANGFAGRWALFLVPALGILVTLLLAALPQLEPRRAHLLASGGLYYAAILGLNALLVVVQVVTVAAATKVAAGTQTHKAIPVGVGLLFVLLGLFLPAVKSNFFMGVRTPWTLTSESTWRRTHRLAGPLFVLAGVAIALAVLLPPAVLPSIIVGAIVVAGGVPVVYSYVVWRSAVDRIPGARLPG